MLLIVELFAGVGKLGTIVGGEGDGGYGSGYTGGYTAT